MTNMASATSAWPQSMQVGEGTAELVLSGFGRRAAAVVRTMRADFFIDQLLRSGTRSVGPLAQ
jgi:hypothetical protein